jgi:hypothetical protein
MAYRHQNKTFKIRKTTTNNSTGDNFALTVPREIAKSYENTVFSISASGSSIVFTSGARI